MRQIKWHKDTTILLFSILIISLCGLLYELLIGATSSYLLGNSVLQFSLTIGAFMTSFGIGSFLSRFVRKKLIRFFFIVETLIGFLGSISIVSLFYFYSVSDLYHYVMYFFIVSIGILIALEIPIIGRIIEGIRKNVRITFANLFGYDYIGAMIGSIVLPLVLLPKLGLIGASILVGMGNLFVAMLVGFRFRKKISKPLLLLPVIFFGLDIVFFIKAQSVENYIEQKFYDQQVIYQERSPYQRIVLTKEDNDLRLFLEGNIQFSSKDEYRYHESLVHVPLALLPQKKSLRVLILGGGDGLAARELLKYPRIREIVICDLDPAVTRLASTHPELLKINQNSLADPRVKLVHEDAYLFLEKFYRNPNRRIQKKWDFVIMDLPDPNNESLSKLYSVKFFQLVANVLEDDGVAVSQSTSPFHAREVFWCIEKTIRKSGFQNVYPYHLDVPSFGIWGMIAFSKEPLSFPGELKVASLSYLKDSLLPGFFSFPKDMDKLEVRHNTLFRPIILDYYEQSWKTY